MPEQEREIHLLIRRRDAVLHARGVYSTAGMRSLGGITCRDCCRHSGQQNVPPQRVPLESVIPTPVGRKVR